MACLINGDTFTWIIKVTNSSIIPVTGVEGAVTLPLGVTFASYSATKGTYDDGTSTWSVGSLAPGASATLTIEVSVTTQALQPFTASVVVSGNEFEPYLLNNIASDQKGGACTDGCLGGFNCSDNTVSCTCGQIVLASGTCNVGSDIEYRIVEASEVNSTVELDISTGHYNVTVLDYNLPWSFDYEIYCCCGEVCTGPLTSCTISGQSPFVVTDVLGYKEYAALLTQTGTDDPVATVIKSDLSGPIVWARTGPGGYTGTLVGAFTDNKTIVFATFAASGGDGYYIYNFTRTNDDIVTMTIFDIASVPADADTDSAISILIRVYN